MALNQLVTAKLVEDLKPESSASLVLMGTYSPAAAYTYVSLKFVRTQDGRIVRAYNYALPNDRDVTRLLQGASPTVP